MDLEQYLRCPACHGPIALSQTAAVCGNCGKTAPVTDGIVRFVESDTHENFGIQWNMFADIQLDSVNGTSESRSRLLQQSGLKPEDFKGKKVLEIGSGAGRFTEILVDFGADIISSDFSAAVDANARSNRAAIERGQLSIVQGDVFALPFKEQAFDIVVGYGMLQHTGNPKRALHSLWKHVKPGGLLLVDQYQLSFRNFLPIKYLLRPITKRLPPRKVLGFSQAVCNAFLPMQRSILRRTQGGGPKAALRMLVNRSVNSVYPVNLEIAGQLDPETATKWSILDTFDQYAPKYDLPCTRGQWRRQLAGLENGEVDYSVDCGQGNAGVVRKVGAAG
jgi:2-polyprenyl-3-methyl-5-hydroxy-6-metoxy-1,4-benzoquinol methylase